MLHHTKYRAALLREMSRVSSLIIVSEVNKANPFVRLYNRIIGENPEQHLTKNDLMSLLSRAGLEIRSFYSVGFFGIPDVFLYAVCQNNEVA